MGALAVLFRGRLIPWWPLWWNELVAPASLSPHGRRGSRSARRLRLRDFVGGGFTGRQRDL